MEKTRSNEHVHIEAKEHVDSEATSQVIGFDDRATKRLIRKIDIHLLPLLALLYLYACFKSLTSVSDHFLVQVVVPRPHRASLHPGTPLHSLTHSCSQNIGNARLAGLENALGMKGLDYNVSLLLSDAAKTPYSMRIVARQIALAVFFPGD